MDVDLIAKAEGQATGLGRYVESLQQGLLRLNIQVRSIMPRPLRLPGSLEELSQRLGYNLSAFFLTYPIAIEPGNADVYHLSSQNLASALFLSRPPRTVVTVHDLLPYLLRKDPALRIYRTAIEALFDHLALAGLKKAGGWIAISEYTRQTMIRALGISPERIHVVHRAVDREVFKPQPLPSNFLNSYSLSDIPYVLFVGSEDARKNLKSLVQAIAILKRNGYRFQFLKIGAPHFENERRKLLDLITRLNLEDTVRFLDHVPNEHLPLFYNAAEVVAIPSLYEGFGLPALEAMSCGAVVAAARSSSLPEVVEDAGVFFDPYCTEDMAECLGKLLANRDLRHLYRQRSLQRADNFSLEKQARQTLAVYQHLCEETFG